MPEDFTFAPAVRESTTAIIAIAGASGSGKTFSSLQLALGLAGDSGKIALIGTEGRRALHYAPAPGQKPDLVNTFPFQHMELHEPYTPARFLAAFKAAEQTGFAVIIVDSFSDEYVGAGGLVDMKEAELEKMKHKNDAAAWSRPKAAHKLVTRWMRTCKCHLIVSLRAEEKVKLEKVGNETKVIPIGWQPVCEKTVPYEMMTSIMLHPASRDDPTAPGKPFPIKIQEQHRAFFPPDRPITREAGRRLAEWAAGGAAPERAPMTPASDTVAQRPQQRPAQPSTAPESGRAPWEWLGEAIRTADSQERLAELDPRLIDMSRHPMWDSLREAHGPSYDKRVALWHERWNAMAEAPA